MHTQPPARNLLESMENARNKTEVRRLGSGSPFSTGSVLRALVPPYKGRPLLANTRTRLTDSSIIPILCSPATKMGL